MPETMIRVARWRSCRSMLSTTYMARFGDTRRRICSPRADITTWAWWSVLATL
jgi:hypothetical protein